MAVMNPYASHLGNRNPREVIAETPQRLAALAERLGAAGMEHSPAPGKWSARQVLCHLADCEMVFAVRIRYALAEPHHVIQPFDQDVWAAPYASMTTQDALAAFASARHWNIALIDTLTKEQLAKRLTHPERGEMPLQAIIDTMGGHDLNHIAQIERIASATAAA
jgi:uncharacterized damage-inducible protein DinB